MSDRMQTPGRPLISVAMPTYRPRRRYLRDAIESVRRQRDPSWELCVVDDGSGDPRLASMLREYASSDDRVRVEILDRNEGISAASNRAVAMSRGEFVAFLDHDDAITPDALAQVARAIGSDPAPDVVYSDQDKLTARGAAVAPFLKPEWSPVYALGAMYVGHLLAVRRSLVDEVGGFDPAYDGIQDFELMLRVSERTDRIRHLPRILYHWRAIPGSIAAGADEKPGVPELQARAVSEHLRRRGIAAAASPHPEIPHRTRLVAAPRRDRPTVAAIVAAGGERADLDRCVESLRRTAYPRLELIVEDPSGPPRRSATLNRGAGRAGGEWLLFCAPHVEHVDADAIDALLAYAEIPGVGVAAPIALHPDGLVAEAGLAVRRWEPGPEGREPSWWNGGSPAEPVMRGARADADGYYGSLSCAREVGAVSGSCMLVSRATFERLGGFDERYRTGYHDVDLCLRTRRAGLTVVCAPLPRVVAHRRSAPADDMVDRALLIDTWFEELDAGDPYLHPGLTTAMAPASEPRPGLVRRIASRL
jgi:O-antigen biosynthesis protein